MDDQFKFDGDAFLVNFVRMHDAMEKKMSYHGYHADWRSVSQHAQLNRRPKPFLTAADLVMLREMKVGL